jgi:hypothetical protein
LEHAVDITDDVDPMTLAIDQAAGHLRSALHAGRGARVEPQVLYARASDLISVLSRAQEVAMALSDQIEKAARTHRLGSDDDRSASEHAGRAACLLVQVAGEVAEAGLAADQAWNALGHLKLGE